MKTMVGRPRSILLLLLLTSVARAQAPSPQPAGWRGDGTGIFATAVPIVEWNGAPTRNILWSTKTGQPAHSSPLLMSGRIFITSPPAQLTCLDAASGRILWQRSNSMADLEPKKPETPPKGTAGNVAATPVGDGRSVWAVFASGIVGCYDIDGKKQWMRWYDAPPAPEYGRAASPRLHGQRLIVSMKCLMALDTRNGNVLWQAPAAAEMYGTPALAKVGEIDIAVTPSGHIVRLSDGALLARDLATTKYSSPIVAGGVAFFIDGTARAVRLSSGAPDRIETKLVWEQDQLQGEFFASPIVHEKIVYTASNEGTFYALDAATGEILIEKELEIPNALATPVAHLYPSPCLAGGNIYLGNDAGDMLILAPGKEYKQLRRNRLGTGSGASPVFDGNRIYLRGGERIFCIGAPARDP